MKLNERFPAGEIMYFNAKLKYMLSKEFNFEYFCETLNNMNYSKVINILKNFFQWSDEVGFRFINFFRQTAYFKLRFAEKNDQVLIDGDSIVLESRIDECLKNKSIHNGKKAFFLNVHLKPFTVSFDRIIENAYFIDTNNFAWPIENVVALETSIKAKVYEKGKPITISSPIKYEF